MSVRDTTSDYYFFERGWSTQSSTALIAHYYETQLYSWNPDYIRVLKLLRKGRLGMLELRIWQLKRRVERILKRCFKHVHC